MAERTAYVHVAKGRVAVNGEVLNGGDGCQVQAESQVEITAEASAEVLLYDLPIGNE